MPKMVQFAKIEKVKCDFFGDFQTLCNRALSLLCWHGLLSKPFQAYVLFLAKENG